jgi:hypothetical protein
MQGDNDESVESIRSLLQLSDTDRKQLQKIAPYFEISQTVRRSAQCAAKQQSQPAPRADESPTKLNSAYAYGAKQHALLFFLPKDATTAEYFLKSPA